MECWGTVPTDSWNCWRVVVDKKPCWWFRWAEGRWGGKQFRIITLIANMTKTHTKVPTKKMSPMTFTTSFMLVLSKASLDSVRERERERERERVWGNRWGCRHVKKKRGHDLGELVSGEILICWAAIIYHYIQFLPRMVSCYVPIYLLSFFKGKKREWNFSPISLSQIINGFFFSFFLSS